MNRSGEEQERYLRDMTSDHNDDEDCKGKSNEEDQEDIDGNSNLEVLDKRAGTCGIHLRLIEVFFVGL